MISYVKIKPTADKAKNWVKGVCTSDDTKPIDGIANGSKLLELDTGKKCVYDEGQTKWIEYGTGEDRSNKPKNVKTEVYKGRLSELFDISKMKTYWNALQAGAIGIITAKVFGESTVYIPINIMPYSIDGVALHLLAANVGLFGAAFMATDDLVAMTQYPKTFTDSNEFKTYIDHIFEYELGLSVFGEIRDLETDNPTFAALYVYANFQGEPALVSIDNSNGLGEFALTFYYMDEGVEPSGGAKVTTETISGPMKNLFAGWSKTKFDQLSADINNGRASARVRVQMGESYFDAQIMPSSTIDELSVLNTSMFTPVGADSSFLIVAITYYYLSDEESVVGLMNYYNPQMNAWRLITDEELSRTTGQTSYDLVITRIEEE